MPSLIMLRKVPREYYEYAIGALNGKLCVHIEHEEFVAIFNGWLNFTCVYSCRLSPKHLAISCRVSFMNVQNEDR